MERKFDVRLECVEGNTISIRIYSAHKLELKVRNIKAFYQMTSCDEVNMVYPSISVDKAAKVKTFAFPKSANEYTSLNFIVKDKVNEVQYAVRVPLDGTEVKYTQMQCE